MKENYIIDKSIINDIVESITEYLDVNCVDTLYLIDSGNYGISLILDTNTVNYTLLEKIYSILKEYGYTVKGSKNKRFDIRKKDKEHRVLITYQITEQNNKVFLEFLIIPQERCCS